jgi:hypothetical protein
MQRGSLAIGSRKEGSAVWQFRWSEKDLHWDRVQRKRVNAQLTAIQTNPQPVLPCASHWQRSIRAK